MAVGRTQEMPATSPELLPLAALTRTKRGLQRWVAGAKPSALLHGFCEEHLPHSPAGPADQAHAEMGGASGSPLDASVGAESPEPSGGTGGLPGNAFVGAPSQALMNEAVVPTLGETARPPLREA